MDYISASDLKSFLDPRAFAVSRTNARGLVDVTQSLSAVETTKAQTTAGLLLTAEQRLTDLRGTLQTMLNLSIEGAKNSRNDRIYDDSYGKLRSLSAGFDQVLESTTYQGKVLFDGRDWELQANGQNVDIETRDLHASGDELALVERGEGARVEVGYDAGTIIRNSYSGLRGLDIADAIGVPPEEGRQELENGKYRLEIEYNGPNSRLVFSDEFGIKIEEITDVDLTGSGIDLVKFKAGIQISLEKLQTSLLYDKWDYENDGPVSVFADLNYERVSWHTLAGDTNSADAVADADWSYKPKKDYTEPALNLGEISPNGVTADKLELAEGDYQLKVKYRGDSSIVEVRDINGNMMARLNNVELGPDSRTYTVDTGVGIKFTIDNEGWGETERDINATFSYKPSPENDRDFDFINYAERLVDAISVIDEQLTSVGGSIDAIQERQQLVNGQGSSNSSATLLLGGGGGITSLLSGGNTQARLSVSGMQLFSSINSAVGTQGGSANILNFLA